MQSIIMFLSLFLYLVSQNYFFISLSLKLILKETSNSISVDKNIVHTSKAYQQIETLSMAL